MFVNAATAAQLSTRIATIFVDNIPEMHSVVSVHLEEFDEILITLLLPEFILEVSQLRMLQTFPTDVLHGGLARSVEQCLNDQELTENPYHFAYTVNVLATGLFEAFDRLFDVNAFYRNTGPTTRKMLSELA